MLAQHILVPTDFSAYADDALDYAIVLAQVLQARLTILHAFHLSSLALGEASPSVIDATLEAMDTHAQQQMQTVLDRVRQAGLQAESASSSENSCHGPNIANMLQKLDGGFKKTQD